MADYLWSDYYKGGESKDIGNGRKLVTKRDIVSAGSEVSAGDLDASDEEYEALKEQGIVRDYPMPEGMWDDDGNLAYSGSPAEYVREELAAAAEEAGETANKEQDILLRSYATGGLFAAPFASEETPEAMAAAATGAEEAKSTKSSSKASASS